MFKNTMNLLVVAWLGLFCAAPVFGQNGELRVDGEVLEDPTKPLSPAEPSGGAQELVAGPTTQSLKLFTVSFVRASGQSPIAIVNDTQVKIGSTIDGATVVGISEKGVELKIGQETRHVAPFASIVRAFK